MTPSLDETASPQPRPDRAVVWRSARLDYEAGYAARDVCDHYGVGLPALKARVRREGWRRAVDDAPETLVDLEALPASEDIDGDGPPVSPRAMIPQIWTQAVRAMRRGRLSEARRWMALCGQVRALDAVFVVNRSLGPDETKLPPARMAGLWVRPHAGPRKADADASDVSSNPGNSRDASALDPDPREPASSSPDGDFPQPAAPDPAPCDASDVSSNPETSGDASSPDPLQVQIAAVREELASVLARIERRRLQRQPANEMYVRQRRLNARLAQLGAAP